MKKEKSVERPWIVLKTDDSDPTSITGNHAELANEFLHPASTRKILIAWAGLEEELIEPSTRYLCSDTHIAKHPVPLNLQEAMLFSSNDYFESLVRRLGIEKIAHYFYQSRWFGEDKLLVDIERDFAKDIYPIKMKKLGFGGYKRNR